MLFDEIENLYFTYKKNMRKEFHVMFVLQSAPPDWLPILRRGNM